MTCVCAERYKGLVQKIEVIFFNFPSGYTGQKDNSLVDLLNFNNCFIRNHLQIHKQEKISSKN